MPLNVNTGGGILATTNFSPNEYELLADYTVSGSAITSYTFSGLKINADEEVVLVSDIYNTSAGNSDIRLSFNGTTSDTSYYQQYISANGTSVGATRWNASYFYINLNAGKKAYTVGNIKLTNNGYITVHVHDLHNYSGSDMYMYEAVNTSTFTFTNINSITISALSYTALGIGSRFQLYKVKGQVQQTWATT